MITEHLQKLYQQHIGEPATQIAEISGSGSNRRYFRLTGKRNLIGVYGTCTEENEAFLYMAEHFKNKNLSVPQVVCVSEDKSCYLQEDLGDTLLFHAIEQGRITKSFSEEEKELLRKTIRQLPNIQFAGADGFDFNRCHPQPEFNQRSVLWDLNYFKYCFLKATGLEFQEDKLEDDFMKMSEVLLRSSSDTFMYRDFQSRNVMIKDGEPWFIDFQGGRRGPVEYDLVSFLWQARARFSPALRRELIGEYLRSASRYRSFDEEAFNRRLQYFVLFRTLQVLGTYGYRGYFEHKAHFVQSIPLAIDNLRSLLAENDFADMPYLSALLREMTALPLFAPYKEDTGLTVRITSFSYKKGIPDDLSGNGGGFVFDCRAIHNPGRYDEYKQLTGRDEPVIAFLDKEEAMQEFLAHVYGIVDYSVEKYLSRGFTHLMVSFGCTGGQHRSVYSAEHLATHLGERYDVRVILEHREQHIRLTMNG